MIFHFYQHPNVMEKYHFACTNTTWTYNLIAVTNKPHFNENDETVLQFQKIICLSENILNIIIRIGKF
mgnify:CR=1 FL=1